MDKVVPMCARGANIRSTNQTCPRERIGIERTLFAHSEREGRLGGGGGGGRDYVPIHN